MQMLYTWVNPKLLISSTLYDLTQHKPNSSGAVCVHPYLPLRCCRHDRLTNARTVLVLHQGGKETPTKWRDVKVGDVVKVTADQEIPADLVVLSTSDSENICHIETANLVGVKLGNWWESFLILKHIVLSWVYQI